MQCDIFVSGMIFSNFEIQIMLMSPHQKLQVAINEVLAVNYKEATGFFINELVPKLQTVHELLYFPAIDHPGFKEYLGWFQNDIEVDIQNCISLTSGNTMERIELLEIIKKHIEAKLKIVEFAFKYYLQDNSPLFQQGDQRKIIQLKPWLQSLLMFAGSAK